jgi:hypothetical protein
VTRCRQHLNANAGKIVLGGRWALILEGATKAQPIPRQLEPLRQAHALLHFRPLLADHLIGLDPRVVERSRDKVLEDWLFRALRFRPRK